MAGLCPALPSGPPLQYHPPVDYAKLTDHSVAGAVGYTLAILALFVGYLIALKALRGLSEDPVQRRWAWAQPRWGWVIVFGGTILFSVTLALAYPTTAIDLLINAVRTRGWALYGLNPLATPPQELPGDPWVGLSGEWSDISSPYGSVWEGASLLAFKLAGGDFLTHVFALKVMAVLAYLGCVILVALILRRLKPEWALVGTAAFAWNPLVLLESVANAHNDILMVLFLLLAIYFAASDRRWLVTPALMLSISTKFVPVVVVPFFWLYLIRLETSWRRRLLVAAGNLALAVGLGVLLMSPGWAVRDLRQEAGKSPFALLVFILRPWLTTNVAFDVARYLMGGIFLLIYLWLAWRALTGPPTLPNVVLVPSFGIFFWYLMLPNQQFHTWYLLWPVAIAVLLIPMLAFTEIFVFGLTALLSITLYETLRVWWWDTLTPLPLHAIAVPLVFGLPLLVGLYYRTRKGRSHDSHSLVS